MKDKNVRDQHLDDESLGAYFDGELAAGEQQRARAHLASCGRCAARLALLSELAVELAELPELPLERDLAPGVLAAIGQRSTAGTEHSRAPAQPQRQRPPALAGRRRRTGMALIFAAQLLGAALLLALAWQGRQAATEPALAERLGAEALLALEGVWGTGETPWELLRAAEAALEALRPPEQTLDSGLNPLDYLPELPSLGSATVALLLTALLWAAGSAALLRPIIRRDASSLARRSFHE